MGRFVDLTGERFERLVVIKRVEDYVSPKGKKTAQWLCECDCGNERVVRGCYLKNKNTKSCGCLQKEKASHIGKENKKYNMYDLTGEYGVGYTTKEEEFYFDLEDYDLIKDYYWGIDANGYVRTRILNGKDKPCIYMHRLVFGLLDSKLDVDHIHHKKNDNRKSELRICTHQENCMNTKIQKNNVTGVTGVSYRKDNCKKKYRVTISANGEDIKIGSYENFEDAVEARIKAENEYYGEYSYRNSQMER